MFPTRNAPDSSREEEEEKVHFPTNENKITTNSQNEEFRPDPLKEIEESKEHKGS